MTETGATFPIDERFTQTARATISWFEECQVETEEWLIERLVPRGAYTGIFGRRGAAKTFLAVHMVLCGALGLPFLGEEVERPFGSIYCVGEKKSRFGKRIHAWRLTHKIKRAAVQFRWGVPNLLDEGDVSDFIAEIQAAKPEFIRRRAPLGAVFLDTLSRSLKGANVSDPDATGIALNAIQRIIDETGVTVVALAHVAKAEGSSTQKGAGEWEDAADALIRIDREDGQALRIVTLTKQSDEVDGLIYGFELQVVDVGTTATGRRVTSCVIRQVDVPLDNGRSVKLSGGARIAKDALAYLVDNHLTVEAPADLTAKAGLKYGQRVVPIDDWKRRSADMGLWDKGDTDANRRQKWFAAKSRVRDAGLVKIEGAYAIPLGPLGGVRP
jgi:KaiC/GvpD/RAD55 family RecA-like ATPase